MATKSYFANSVPEFVSCSTDDIVGRLATQVGIQFDGNQKQQITAWRAQIDLLKSGYFTRFSQGFVSVIIVIGV